MDFTGSRRLLEYLDTVRAGSEDLLAKRKRDRDAWRLIEVAFGGPGLFPGSGGYVEQQEAALGARSLDPMTESDTWRAATVAAVADAARHRLNDPWSLFSAGAYIEHARILGILRRTLPKAEQEKLTAEIEREQFERSSKGGSHGRGTAKQRHTELIWRVVDFLIERQAPVSLDAVRAILRIEGHWRALAYELGDPLSDIVNVNVQAGGTLEIEYTAKWAARHKKKTSFVEIKPKAFKAAVDRRLEMLEAGKIDTAAHR